MSTGETCGYMCQHPSCWAAERERIRQAYYNKNGVVIRDSEKLESYNRKIPDQSEFKWSTYTVINLSDLIDKAEHPTRGVARTKSTSSLCSSQSSENATRISKSLREELFGSSTRSLSTALSSFEDVSPPPSPLAQKEENKKETKFVDASYKDRNGNFRFPVLSVKLSGGESSDLSGQYPRLIWIPGKKKWKKKIAEMKERSEKTGQLSLKYFDGDLLSLDSWITYKNGLARTRYGQYSASTHRAIMRHIPRRLPPLDASSTPRHSSSRKSTRSAGERAIDKDVYTPLTVSQPLQLKDVERKDINTAIYRQGTPNNTRNTERVPNEVGETLDSDKIWEQDDPRSKDTIFLDNGLLMVPVRDEPLQVVYEGRRQRNTTTRETINLPRIAVPKQYLKQMPVLDHHCRNSVPRYWIPEVQLEPLKGSGATPSVASTDSLIRRISMDLADDFADRNIPNLEADASSLKAYKKLLQDFPDLTPESENASVSSDAMEWQFPEGGRTPLPTPATPVDHRERRERAAGITRGTISKSEHVLNLVKKPSRGAEGGLGAEHVLSDGALVVNKSQVQESSTDKIAPNAEHMKTTVVQMEEENKSSSPSLNDTDGMEENGELESNELRETDLNLFLEVDDERVSTVNSMEEKQETTVDRAPSEVEDDRKAVKGESCQSIASLSESPPLKESQEQLVLTATSSNVNTVKASISYAYGTPLTKQEAKHEEFVDKSRSLPLFRIPDADDMCSNNRQWQFIPTSKKQPPLLMSTPGRAPPQPGRQPSPTSVPNELKVRSFDLFQRTNKSTVDLSSSLVIEKLSLNEPRRGSSMQHGISPDTSSVMGSTVSTPIVVPTMDTSERRESSENLTLSPEKSKSIFSYSSEAYSAADGRTSSVNTETKTMEERDVDAEAMGNENTTEDDLSVASLDENISIPEGVVPSPIYPCSDVDGEGSLMNVSRSSSRTGSRDNDSAMLHAALSSFLSQGNAQRNDSQMSSRLSYTLDQELAPKEAPPSSPVLSIPDFTAGLDLNLNLEEELQKAVEGLEGFSFDDLEISSVQSFDFGSIKLE